VSEKISDDRFAKMSKLYEQEQSEKGIKIKAQSGNIWIIRNLPGT